MSSDQVLPSALIDIGNRCGVRLKDMDWNFKVEADGTILGSQMRPAGSGEKKVPVKLRIFESGGVYVYPHKASRYPRDCKKEITQDEVRGIRRELPGACAETTQSLSKRFKMRVLVQGYHTVQPFNYRVMISLSTPLPYLRIGRTVSSK